ncbi:hypothetical protein F5Y05DRAFT_381090 [Hypoxylon sp. FL0543]|nr:hypothetical protein F5Y05DRAFT_381090 [Hypoxylon sp. FL0543]
MTTTPSVQVGQLDSLSMPALPPPDGVIPNFDNPPRYNTSGYALCSFFLAVASIAMLLRVYARVWCAKKVRLEDFLGFAGYALFTAYIVAVILVIERPGFYVHQWDVRVGDMPRILYIFYVSSNCYNGAIGCLKAAILLEWLHVFNPLHVRNTFYWVCQAMLWVNVLYYAASQIAINVICTPHAKIWDKTIVGGHCGDSDTLYFSGTIINLISDLLILSLPQSVIWSLKMSKPKKLGVSLIFAIGVLCCIVACFRIVTTVALPKTTDFIYTLPELAFWGSSEMLLVMLVFCVPAFPHAFRGMGLIKRATPSRSQDVSTMNSRKQMWTRTNISTGNQSVYRKIDDYNLVPLKNVKPTIVQTTSSTEEINGRQHHATAVPRNGIVWTREFSTREDFIPERTSHDDRHDYP